MKRLVLIHGRSQQLKDDVKLKSDWIGAWERGLAQNGLKIPIPQDRIKFVYYGNTLAGMVAGETADEAAKIIVRGAQDNPAAAEFLSVMLQEFIDVANITDEEIEDNLDAASMVIERSPQNWGWVQAILRAIDKRTPGGGAMIALVTNDVHKYLTDGEIRRHIERGVHDAMDLDSDNVIVSHSLGTVVAYTALRERSKEAAPWKVPLLITLGSPLGIRAVRSKLRPIGHPACVGKWYNAYDPNDVVSLNPLDKANFNVTPLIVNYGAVDNWTDNQHGIVGYLDDAVVARRIYDALI